jgi:hypothetical protein
VRAKNYDEIRCSTILEKKKEGKYPSYTKKISETKKKTSQRELQNTQIDKIKIKQRTIQKPKK